MSDTFSDILALAIEQALSEVHTTVPGRIVSYDAATNRAVVQPVLPKMLADGRTLNAPNIVSVPMVWPSMGGATFSMPVTAGDGVMLHFASRSLEGWLSGSDEAPDDPRMFDLTDAIAVPGLSASRPAVDPENMVISFGGAEIKITPDGKINMTCTEFNVNGINLFTHRHPGVSGGPING